MYVMHYTRLDIDYDVGALRKFTINLRVEYWIVIIGVLRYLKGAINVGIHYFTFSGVLECYSNAIWNFNPNE